jgi:hypothetical protein
MHPPKLEDLARAFTSATDGDLNDLTATRRGLILAPLLAALPAALFADPARAIDRRRRKSPCLINTSGSPRYRARRRSRSRRCRCSA